MARISLAVRRLGAASLSLSCLIQACSKAQPSLQLQTPAQSNSTGASSQRASSPSVAETTIDVQSRNEDAPLRLLNVASGSKTTKSQFGIVTTVEAHATNVGVGVLQAGGNAVDAAVAVGYALAVTHPSAGNLGGGGFMTVKLVGQPTQTLEFREQAPASVTQAAFDAMIARKGRGLGASGIPGTVAGLNSARARWGTLPLAQLVAPAIALAQQGVPLGERQALVLSWAWPMLKRDGYLAATLGTKGQPKQEGEIVRQPQLAATLEAIARQDNEGFYSGVFAERFVALTSTSDIPVSAQELRQYEARLREPMTIRYRDLLVETTPPPSAGGVAVLQLLAMLERERSFTLRGDSPEELHLFAEAAKRAHAERRFNVVDPFGVANYDDTKRRARWRSADTWLQPFPISRSHSTSAATLSPHYAAATKELSDTTHFSVVDSQGNVVSCTTTLSGSFGARYVVPGTGVIMNNSLGAFSTVGANTLRPGRRMTSSMAPTIVSDERGPVLVLGSPGGDTIANTIVTVLRRVVDHGQPLDVAVDAPRLHHGFVPDALRSERLRPISSALRHGLEQLGHQFVTPTRTIGDANNLARTQAGWEGYSDPREGGLAAAPTKAPPLPQSPSP
jgi:gamma-glutamyltranspeptidase / glutathione hydrolase